MKNKITILLLLIAFMGMSGLIQAQSDIEISGNNVAILDGDTTPDTADDTDFGYVSVSSSVFVDYTITNPGDVVLNLTDIGTSNYVAISGTHASDFAVTTEPSATVGTGGGTTTFRITFTPSAAGLREATITVKSDEQDFSSDGDETTYTFDIQGTGAGEIDVQRVGSIASGANDDLGDRATGTEFTITYTVEETAGYEIQVSDIVSSNENNCSIGTIDPTSFSITSTTATFDVPVTVSAAGAFDFDITITNNDSDEGTYVLDVTGTGIPGEIDVQRPAATSIADEGTDDLGNKSVGTFTVSYTIEELDGSDLVITNIATANPSNCAATVTSATSGTLNSTGTATMTLDIEVTVSAAGAFSFEIDITSDDADEGNYDITASGIGVDGDILVEYDGSPIISSSTNDIGDVDGGSAVTFTFTVTEMLGADFVFNDFVSYAHGNATMVSYTASETLPHTLNNSSMTFDIVLDLSIAGPITFDWGIQDDSYTYVHFAYFVANVVAPTAPPTLVAPLDDAVAVSLEPIFEWDQAYSPLQLQIATEDDFDANSIVYDNAVISGATFDMATVTDLLDGNTLYYWRVAATFGGVQGDWSDVWSFRTIYEFTVNLISPTGGIDLNADEATLTWNSNVTGGNETYDLFYSTTDPGAGGFVGDTPQEAGLTEKTFLLENLPPGATYYWQVRVITSSGTLCGYSTMETFKSSGDLQIPIPLAPVADIEIQSTSPTVYWFCYLYHPAIVYQVQYSTDGHVDANFELDQGTILQTSWTHDTNIQLTNLTPGQPYYWQIRTSDDDGVSSWSQWSDPVSFQVYGTPGTTAIAPEPTYPTDGVSIYSTTAITYWNMVGNGAGLNFQVRYGTDPTMDGTWLLNEENMVETNGMFKQLSSLTDGEKYYWQVRSYTGVAPTTEIDASASAWSDVNDFFVRASEESERIPIAYDPIDEKIVTSSRPTLSYYTLGYSYGLEYEVLYSDSDVTNAGELDGTGGFVAALPVTTNLFSYIDVDLAPGVYYWQVRSWKDGVESSWSEVESFEVDPTAAYTSIIPTPAYPIGGITIDTKTPEFVISVNGNYTNLEYVLRYATHNNTTNGELDMPYVEWPSGSWNADLDFPALTTNLVAGGIYYWQVKSQVVGNVDVLKESAFSTLANFIVSSGASPGMVILGSPVGDVQIGTTAPTFSWIMPTQSTSQLSYEVELADNQFMAGANVVSSNSLSAQTQNLEDGKQYYWRVRSKTAGGEYSLYSMTTSFTVNSSITDVEAEEELPTDFRLDQNYPNPFNPSTTIKFALPEAQHVSIKIYDMLGREVARVLEQDMQAGVHTAIWNGEDSNGRIVNTGVYFYRIVSGSNVAIKKMLLLK
ncbi:MAG: choice-of-anchor D domain-containing protein [Bacteroidetes bacterium]|nr:choice-of-anchor D domain-containing protein [Bacteroidota bacterium]